MDLRTRLLLIDDADEIGDLVKLGLQSYQIDQARSLSEAQPLIDQNAYDLVLIDVSLPDGNGFDFCLKLCQNPRYTETPKILLTAHVEVNEKVYGFNCGADDYITKPFDPMELKARVDRYLRKSKQISNNPMIDCFEFNLEFQQCFIHENGQRKDLDLTPTEFRIFLSLVRNKNHVLSRQSLEKLGWESQGTVIQLRGIDTHITHLRKKIGAYGPMIVSVYGQGYAYTTDSTAKMKMIS